MTPSSGATDEGVAFVDALSSASDKARTSGAPVVDHWLRVAGRVVLVRVAGADLDARLTPALAHLEGPPVERARLTIDCWDRVATGVAPPPPPADLDDFLAGGRMRGFVAERVRMNYDSMMRMLTVYDRERGRAFVHVADPALLPSWVDRAPVRGILTWWASDLGLAFLHSSAVATPAGAIAIAGASGSGKSTTALACVADGWRLLGDDACIVDLESTPLVHSVYAFAKLEPDAYERLPSLRSLPSRMIIEQPVLDPVDVLVSSAPLRALVLPRVSGDNSTRAARADPSDALHTLVSSSLLEGGRAGGSALGAMAQLVKRVPCLRVDLGTDMDGVVDAMGAIVDSA